MSNTFAIPAVTATLSTLLEPVGTIRFERPTDISGGDTGLNLFLYQVSHNPGLRNEDLPFRDGGGWLVRQPVVALNLSYLITVVGGAPEAELDAQHKLGQAMSLLHDNAVLTRAQIRAAVGSLPEVDGLDGADLADQLEAVKLTPIPLTSEDQHRMWAAFTVAYRLSVAYEASVVLISRPRPTRATLPVRRATVTTVPIRRPWIDAVLPQIATSGATLTIEGRDLAAEGTRVAFAMGDEPPTKLTDRRIEVVAPTALRAGVQRLRVVQPVVLGTPQSARPGFESNLGVFTLAPKIQTAPPYVVTLGQQDGVLTLDLEPPVTRRQRVALIAGDQTLLRRPPEGATPETAKATFTVPAAFPKGRHLMRVSVDGAETALKVDTDPSSPTYDQYLGPVLEVKSA